MVPEGRPWVGGGEVAAKSILAPYQEELPIRPADQPSGKLCVFLGFQSGMSRDWKGLCWFCCKGMVA